MANFEELTDVHSSCLSGDENIRRKVNNKQGVYMHSQTECEETRGVANG